MPTAPMTRTPRAVPNNQTATMGAYTDPSYRMPPGAAAIANARRGARNPLYSDPSQIPPSRFQSLWQGMGAPRGGTPASAATLPADDGSGDPGTSLGLSLGAPTGGNPDSYTGAMDALGELGGAQRPRYADGFGNGADEYSGGARGPTVQTAPGGVVHPDFSQPAAWTSFFNKRGLQGANAPPPPRLMTSSRLSTAPQRTS